MTNKKDDKKKNIENIKADVNQDGIVNQPKDYTPTKQDDVVIFKK